MPLTLSLRHSRPHTWYFSPRRGGVIEQPASTDSEEIIARFLNEADAEAAKLDLDGQVDVVAIYICSVRVVDAKGNAVSTTTTLNNSWGSGVWVRGAARMLSFAKEGAVAASVPPVSGLRLELAGEADAAASSAAPAPPPASEPPASPAAATTRVAAQSRFGGLRPVAQPSFTVAQVVGAIMRHTGARGEHELGDLRRRGGAGG
jgi:hypothetical protein